MPINYRRFLRQCLLSNAGPGSIRLPPEITRLSDIACRHPVNTPCSQNIISGIWTTSKIFIRPTNSCPYGGYRYMIIPCVLIQERKQTTPQHAISSSHVYRTCARTRASVPRDSSGAKAHLQHQLVNFILVAVAVACLSYISAASQKLGHEYYN